MIIKCIMQLERFTNGIFSFWKKTQMHCFGQVREDQCQITIIESTPCVYTRSTKDGLLLERVGFPSFGSLNSALFDRTFALASSLCRLVLNNSYWFSTIFANARRFVLLRSSNHHHSTISSVRSCLNFVHVYRVRSVIKQLPTNVYGRLQRDLPVTTRITSARRTHANLTWNVRRQPVASVYRKCTIRGSKNVKTKTTSFFHIVL